MDDLSFDELTKSLSQTTSRRQALKLVAGAVGGAILAMIPGAATLAIAPGRCRNNGSPCRQAIECCSAYCDPISEQCACTPGSIVCPSSGDCVPGCQPSEVFNPETCECQCVGFAGTPCATNSDCCAGFHCQPVGKGGSRVCQSGECVNPPICSTTFNCCPGFFCSLVPGSNDGVCLPTAA
jgi:CXCXC repeat protein